jgi:hypothetical protein
MSSSGACPLTKVQLDEGIQQILQQVHYYFRVSNHMYIPHFERSVLFSDYLIVYNQFSRNLQKRKINTFFASLDYDESHSSPTYSQF